MVPEFQLLRDIDIFKSCSRHKEECQCIVKRVFKKGSLFFRTNEFDKKGVVLFQINQTQDRISFDQLLQVDWVYSIKNVKRTYKL